MSRPFEIIDCAHSRPARYDERTSGPASTPRNPMRSASSLNSTNSCGLTQRSTGRCRGDGRRYCVIVMMSVPASCRSCSACTTSAGSSPMPRMRFDFVMRPKSRACVMHIERALVAEGRADALEDARHGLDVVREHLRPRLEHLAQQRRVAREVRREDLDAGAGVLGVDAPHGLGVQPRALVGQIVARDAGDRRVAQSHLARRSRRLGAARRCRSRRACRCRSGRSRSGACTASRRSGTSPRGPPSTRRCSGSRPPGRPCAGPRP